MSILILGIAIIAALIRIAIVFEESGDNRNQFGDTK